MIKLMNVCKSFKHQKVLDNLTLSIPAETISVIIGQSGTGKSVLLKHMIALMRPDSGQIFINDTDITRQDEKALGEIRKQFGMLFQGAALFDSMTVGENIAFPIREHTDCSKNEVEQIVHEKLRQVGLVDVYHKMPSELSGGMRKRVGLARAIALDPKIILFDEPTTGLDPIMKDAIDNLIAETQQRSRATCVVISHDMDSALRIGHFVALISEGKIVESGTPEDIRRSRHPVIRQFLDGGKSRDAAEKVPGGLP